MFSFSAILWMCRLKQKALNCNDTSSSHFVCQAAWQTSKIWMHHLAFEYGFYFKFYEYSNEMLLTGSCSTVQTLIVSRDQHWFSSKPVLCSDRFACATLNYWSELINGLRCASQTSSAVFVTLLFRLPFHVSHIQHLWVRQRGSCTSATTKINLVAPAEKLSQNTTFWSQSGALE